MNPFEETDEGLYRVTAPYEDAEPEAVTITTDGTTYTLTDFAGYDYESLCDPNVLLYETCIEVDTEQSIVAGIK